MRLRMPLLLRRHCSRLMNRLHLLLRLRLLNQRNRLHLLRPKRRHNP